MTLRARFIAYLVLVHALLAGVAVPLLLRNRLWLIAAETVFALSLAAGIVLARRMFATFGFAREGVRLIGEHEFTSRLLEVGQPEVDELIGVYNRMVDHLRDERTRLQEQHHFLSQILRVSPSGIVVLDFDQRISEANPAAERLLGRPAAEMIGRRVGDLGTPLAADLAAFLPGETRVVGLSGARRVKCYRGTFLDRGFARSFFSIEELTEELRQFERAAYEKLIRVMSHEVNNSVAASNSLLHSCLTYGRELAPDSRGDFERAIAVVIERTEQLNAFMRRFADVFRLPAPVKRPCRVLEILERTVRLVSARPEAARVAWRWAVDDPTLKAPMDRAQMEQALLNVLQNALDAVGGDGTITIRLTGKSGRPLVVIEDSGPGLTPEAQANLFTPFFSTKPHGQGIGLTVVQEIMAGHGFDYALERAPDATRFTIVLG